MHYEINIAKKEKDSSSYRHFFATAPRSITDDQKLFEVVRELKKKFPEPEYNLTVSKWETIGKDVDVTEIVEKVTIPAEKLEKGFYLFGNKGAMWSNKLHIANSGSNLTLCGTPMLSTNYAKAATVQEAGCPECIARYTPFLKPKN